MFRAKWTEADVPDQVGRTAVVTGANTGLGYDTDLARHLPRWMQLTAKVTAKLAVQSAAEGALPSLRAATDPAAVGGQYYGPDGLGEVKGSPKVVDSSAQSKDENLQRHLGPCRRS